MKDHVDVYLLSQEEYAYDLLASLRITDSRITPIPLDSNVQLTSFDGIPLENSSMYRQIIRSLIYMTVTCLDIVYVVYIVSQLMVAPRTIHFISILRILRYVKEILVHRLHSSILSHPSCYLTILMQIGLGILQIYVLQQVNVIIQEIPLSLGEVSKYVVCRYCTKSKYRALADAIL